MKFGTEQVKQTLPTLANAKQLEGNCENSGKGLSICHVD